MKRIIYIFSIVLVLSLLLSACTNKGSKKDVSMYDLGKAMIAASDKFSDMQYASSEDDGAESIFKNVSSMDYSKVDSYLLYYAKDGKGNADEIVVIRVKNIGDLSTAKESLNAHVSKRISLYETYDKSQLTKLNSAKVFTYSDFAVLIVADDVNAVEKAFNNYFSD